MTEQTTTDLIRQWAFERNLHSADPTKQALKLGAFPKDLIIVEEGD